MWIGKNLAAILGLIAMLALFSPVSAETSKYILGAGDKLRIMVFGEKELSGDFVISAVNGLSLPLVGEVSTKGADIRVLQNRIVEKLKDGYLINPRVTVEVIQYRPFYILGNVQAPGSYSYVNGMTILNAIALAGGLERTEQDGARLRLLLTRALEDVDRLEAKYHSALAEEARFIAERDKLDHIDYPTELAAQRTDSEIKKIMEGETRIFEAHRSSFEAQTHGIIEKNAQYGVEISAIRMQNKADSRRLVLLKSEISDLDKLLKKGYARKPQLTKLKRQAAQIENDKAGNRLKIALTRQKISEAKLRMSTLKDENFNQTIQNLQHVRQKISDIELEMRADKDVLRQTRIKIQGTELSHNSEKNSKIIITRLTVSGSRSLEVFDDAPVLPGDIIRVPGAFGLVSSDLKGAEKGTKD